MKNKLKLFGVIAVVAIIGYSLVGCGVDTGGFDLGGDGGGDGGGGGGGDELVLFDGGWKIPEPSGAYFYSSDGKALVGMRQGNQDFYNFDFGPGFRVTGGAGPVVYYSKIVITYGDSLDWFGGAVVLTGGSDSDYSSEWFDKTEKTIDLTEHAHWGSYQEVKSFTVQLQGGGGTPKTITKIAFK